MSSSMSTHYGLATVTPPPPPWAAAIERLEVRLAEAEKRIAELENKVSESRETRPDSGAPSGRPD